MPSNSPRRTGRATRPIESLTTAKPGFLAVTTVVELARVLESAYGLGRDEVAEALEGLLRTQELVAEDPDVVWQALRLFRSTPRISRTARSRGAPPRRAASGR